MRTKTTVKPEMEILFVLAEHSEFEQYKLPKETGISYRTILRSLKLMEKADWIRLVRTEASEKGGKERNIFSITLAGLILVLHEREPLWGQIDKIAKQHTEKLSLIFGKWGFFQENGIRDTIIQRLRYAISLSRIPVYAYDLKALKQKMQSVETGQFVKGVETRLSPIDRKKYGEAGAKELIEKIVKRHASIVKSRMDEIPYSLDREKHRLINNVFGLYYIYPSRPDELEESVKLLEVVRKDSEIRAYVDNEINEIEKEFTQNLANIKSWKQILGTF
jgi:DNA-binding PadR family transcriptional regulator